MYVATTCIKLRQTVESNSGGYCAAKSSLAIVPITYMEASPGLPEAIKLSDAHTCVISTNSVNIHTGGKHFHVGKYSFSTTIDQRLVSNWLSRVPVPLTMVADGFPIAMALAEAMGMLL